MVINQTDDSTLVVKDCRSYLSFLPEYNIKLLMKTCYKLIFLFVMSRSPKFLFWLHVAYFSAMIAIVNYQ